MQSGFPRKPLYSFFLDSQIINLKSSLYKYFTISSTTKLLDPVKNHKYFKVRYVGFYLSFYLNFARTSKTTDTYASQIKTDLATLFGI